MKDIINFLNKQFVEGVDFSASEKDPEVQARYENELFDWFLQGLEQKDYEINRAVLGIIEKYQASVYALGLPKEDWRSVVADYAKFGSVLSRAERGEAMQPRTLTVDFNPFYGSAQEMLSCFRKFASSNSAIQPVRDLFDAVNEFTQLVSMPQLVYGQAPELLEVVRTFLLSWLADFWPLLEANEAEFIQSSFEPSCALSVMLAFVCDLSDSKEFEPCVDALFAFAVKCEDKYALSQDEDFELIVFDNWLDWIVNVAVWESDMHLFQLAIEQARKRNLEIRIFWPDAWRK